MKLVLKILGSTVLIALCLAILAYAGFFLWSAIPRERPEPEVLRADFLLEEEEAPLIPEAPIIPEEETAETAEPEPPVEEEPVEEEPIPEEEPVETEPDYAAMAQAYLEAMTLEEKLWQLFIVTPEDLTGQSPVTIASTWTEDALQANPVGGLIYFKDNLIDSYQTWLMLNDTQSYAKTPLFLAIEEEGGSYSTAGINGNLGVTHFDSAKALGEQGDAGTVYEVGKALAQQLGDLGFNLTLGPVADVITNSSHNSLGDRVYSDDPKVAGLMVASMVEGLQRNGMTACLRHFPGHGSTAVDTNLGLSVSKRTVQEMKETEWRSFAAGINADVACIMVGHLRNFGISEYPASMSPEIMGYLRDDLGFEGVIITDSLKTGSIVNNYTSTEAAVLAITAGADMLLMPNDLLTAFTGLLAAIQDETITEERIDESVLRILTAKYTMGIME